MCKALKTRDGIELIDHSVRNPLRSGALIANAAFNALRRGFDSKAAKWHRDVMISYNFTPEVWKSMEIGLSMANPRSLLLEICRSRIFVYTEDYQYIMRLQGALASCTCRQFAPSVDMKSKNNHGSIYSIFSSFPICVRLRYPRLAMHYFLWFLGVFADS